MRSQFLALVAAIGLAAPASASTITGAFTSFHVLGDSLSDDGNLLGPVWHFATGGAPFKGSFWRGGTFTNGDVWATSLQREFSRGGRDAANYAVGKAQSSGGTLFFPDLGKQIGKLLDRTSPRTRGTNPLASIWIGANNIVDTLKEGGNATRTALAAANRVANAARRLAAAGIDDLLIFNLPDLGRTPQFNLFERERKTAATAATLAYNARITQNIATLEAEGVNVIPVDAFTLMEDAIRFPRVHGLGNVTLPCVFPTRALARQYGQPTRCGSDTARSRLFVDALHPNVRAHQAIAAEVRRALEAEIAAPPAFAGRFAAAGLAPEAPLLATPLPPAAAMLLAALGGLGLVARRAARGAHPAPARPAPGSA